MRVAYFDAVSGAAGDMVIGALLDAGLDLDVLRNELAGLPIGEYTLTAERVQKQHVAATQFLVHAPKDQHHHRDHGMGVSPHPGRALRDILQLIENSRLAVPVKERALAIFRCIGAAESRIHGVPVDEVHFHEVGEIDSIVDIVGASLALELMKIERVFASPLPLGSGTIRTQHGVYPIPAPATLEILARAGAPTRPGVVGMEQVTPTGAAILATVGTFDQPSMRIEAVGYGAGEADLEVPNVLRVWIGESGDSPAAEQLSVIETNVDDMQPEILAHVAERCLEEGALDVLLVPAVMKKGRPGTKMEVLSDPGVADRLVQLLLRETSTLGVRAHSVHRYRAERSVVPVNTEYGPVPIKLKIVEGRPVGAAPEYEACRALAGERGVPLLDVFGAAMAAGRALLVERG